MRPRQARLRADYKQAAALLADDLVWSGDFENIRVDLMEIILSHVKADYYPLPMNELVQKLIATENDLTI
jgi:hypothetical protein